MRMSSFLMYVPSSWRNDRGSRSQAVAVGGQSVATSTSRPGSIRDGFSGSRPSLAAMFRNLTLVLRPRCWTMLLSATVVTACGATPPPTPSLNAGVQQFVGSAACESCHRDVYSRWKTTLMANVVRDPKQHPEAIIGDFSTAESPRHVQERRRRVHLRQQMEAALFHEDWRRLLRLSGPMGRAEQDRGARIRRGRGTDWWTNLLPR